MKKLFQNWGLITKDEENKSEIKSTEIPVIPITANVIVSTEEGNTLDFGYSGCEGFTLYNGERIPELD